MIYQYLLVGAIVLICLFYTVRKGIAILRGRDSDGCAFCSGSSQTRSCRSCLGCSQRETCNLGRHGSDRS